jgi:hypothetical protein
MLAFVSFLMFFIVLAGCRKLNTESEVSSIADNMPLTGFRNAVKSAYGESYMSTIPLTKKQIEEEFRLTPELYVDILAEGPAMQSYADTFVAVKAKRGHAEAVASAFQGYKKRQMAKWLNNPEMLAKLRASKIEIFEDYVFFLVQGRALPDYAKDNSEAAISYSEKQSDIGVRAIAGYLEQRA